MRLLIVGGGGREHALADKLRRDAPEAELFAAPGNPGVTALAETIPLAADDLDGLSAFAEEREVDLTVVGPETPLAAGLADRFAERGLTVFGPSAGAARIEASKAFAKRLMRETGVPTAEFEVFDTAEAAREFIEAREPPLVVKASGLAAGKGALVCRSRQAALEAVRELMVERRFGDAGNEVVVEGFLEGVELSVFFLCDGEDAVPLGSSRDYKRIGEGDRGPNTGGMGAYAPAGVPRPETGGPRSGDEEGAARRAALVEEVREKIALPVIRGLAERGAPYRGFLYAGLMLTRSGPQVVEFNCRLGDPEAQVVLPLTESDLVEPMAAVARGERLSGWTARTAPGAALVTVLASEGYPGSYRKGAPIDIPPDLESEDLRVYHAGTALRDARLVTDGGRVLGITGLGPDLGTAAARSRRGAAAVGFPGKQWRSDIGWHEGISVAAEDARDRPASGGAQPVGGAEGVDPMAGAGRAEV